MSVEVPGGLSKQHGILPALGLVALATVGVLGATTVSVQAFSLTTGSQPGTFSSEVLPSLTDSLSSPLASSRQLSMSESLATLFARTPTTTGENSSASASEVSDFSDMSSLAGWRSTEVRVAVNVLTFVHDAMEDIEVAQSSFGVTKDSYRQTPASTLHGSSDPAAQSNPSDALTQARKGAGGYLASSAPKAADAFTRTQRDSEAQEHELESRDVALAQQLRSDSGQGGGSLSAPAAASTFDPTHNELGYTQYYKEVASDAYGESNSGSIVINIGLFLLALGALKFSLNVFLPPAS
jgi:hypothetical protein